MYNLQGDFDRLTAVHMAKIQKRSKLARKSKRDGDDAATLAIAQEIAQATRKFKSEHTKLGKRLAKHDAWVDSML